MKPFMRGLMAALLATVLISGTARAQATAQISGSVKDQTGAVLPGAEISATQTDTGVIRNALTNETGSYTLSNLPTGPYRLEVGMAGFKTFVQSGIVLQVNSAPDVNVVLEIGQVSDQVEVQANAALVETRTTGVGQVIENERILELPLNGRQVTDLIVLAGGAVQTSTAASRQMQGGVGVSVAGGLSTGVAYILDGAMHNDPSNNLNLPLPFPDALQEFKVETSGLSANNGMHGGASVNSVTKSGTNELHGGLFEFVRNGKFNARNAFAASRDSLKRNQFGGTVGGPLKKNTLFFFGGYQGTITRSDPSETIRFVPTAAALAGDFTNLASAACNAGTARQLRTPYSGNKIDPGAYSKPALAIAAKLPKAQDECGKVTFGIPARPDEMQALGKVDYQRSERNSIFGRYMATTYFAAVPFDFSNGNLLTTTTAGRDNLAQVGTIGDTYLINSNIVNSFRLALNRSAIRRTNKTFFSAADLGINIYSGYVPNFMLLNVTGGFNLGGGTECCATFRTTTYQIAEDVSIVHGSHQLAVGVNVAHWRMNYNANVRSPGSFAFDGSITGLGLADFMVGKTSLFLQAAPNSEYMKEWYLGVYAADSWKITPRLTVNAGLRWEPYFPQVLTDGRAYNFSMDRLQKGIKSTQYTKAPAGFYYPGDPGFPGKAGKYVEWKNTGPRLGLAWDVQGDGRTSVRASYGLTYDFPNGEYQLTAVIAPPWGGDLRIAAPVGGMEDPYLGFPGGNPFPLVYGKDIAFTPYGPFLPLPYETKTPYAQSWNLSLQRQLASSWLLTTSYLGSQTTHIWTTQMLNPGLYFFNGTATCTLPNGTVITGTGTQCSTNTNLDQRRRLSISNPADGLYIGSLDQYDGGGTQSYSGLQLSLQRRASKGINVSSNYTWSHCIGDPNSFGGNQVQAASYQEENNRASNRGNCDSDRRHIANFTVVAQTPTFANSTVRAIAGGWRVSGIYRVSSGSYLTVTSGQDRALNGNTNQRPNQVLENVYGDKTATNYLNTKAFAVPDFGTVGSMKRANIRGPNSWQFDAALSRTFNVTESQKMEFRAEAFNVTNSVRLNNPTTALNSNIFGQINGAGDPRIMQFALKYVF